MHVVPEDPKFEHDKRRKYANNVHAVTQPAAFDSAGALADENYARAGCLDPSWAAHPAVFDSAGVLADENYARAGCLDPSWAAHPAVFDSAVVLGGKHLVRDLCPVPPLSVVSASHAVLCANCMLYVF